MQLEFNEENDLRLISSFVEHLTRNKLYTDEIEAKLKVFIDIRDKLAHEGLTSTHPTDECVKLHSLVVRVLLAFLGYEGNYQEYARTTVDLEATGDYHTQNKIFKLTSE